MSDIKMTAPIDWEGMMNAQAARIREQRDLLDECERFMGRTDEKDLNVCSPEWWTEFYRLFAKLRGEPPAQENADE